ncbi:MAG: hypothetical protein HEQ13_00310 [Dolichospermum sp. DEX189]|nr:hypothetical protein [Dolichospermum sp. DEX189]
MNQKYFSYFTFGLTRIIDRTLLNKRQEIFNVFSKVFNPQSYDKILDIGVSSEEHWLLRLFYGD